MNFKHILSHARFFTNIIYISCVPYNLPHLREDCLIKYSAGYVSQISLATSRNMPLRLEVIFEAKEGAYSDHAQKQ